jgi:hypothetical protein
MGTVKLRIVDSQDRSKPAGFLIEASDVTNLMEVFRRRAPFFFEVRGEHPFKLLVGVGHGIGCVQRSPANDDPPYWMAIEPGRSNQPDGIMGFLVEDTLTEVSSRYRLEHDTVVRVVSFFADSGQRDPRCIWEEI